MMHMEFMLGWVGVLIRAVAHLSPRLNEWDLTLPLVTLSFHPPLPHGRMFMFINIYMKKERKGKRERSQSTHNSSLSMPGHFPQSPPLALPHVSLSLSLPPSSLHLVVVRRNKPPHPPSPQSLQGQEPGLFPAYERETERERKRERESERKVRNVIEGETLRAREREREGIRGETEISGTGEWGVEEERGGEQDGEGMEPEEEKTH